MYGKGYQVLTADGVVGGSGNTIVVYGLNIVSNGVTAGTVILRNGTVVGDDAILTIKSSSLDTEVIDFGGVGVIFPSGCFCDIDATTDSVTIWYERV